jgi:hypothetical protein
MGPACFSACEHRGIVSLDQALVGVPRLRDCPLLLRDTHLLLTPLSQFSPDLILGLFNAAVTDDGIALARQSAHVKH